MSLPEHYSQAAVERVATAVVTDITRSQPVNEISILFYGPGTSTAGAYDIAAVDWAPSGKWGDGDSVQAGNYSTFRYSVTYRPPSPKAPAGAAVLTRSTKTGLLGASLPNGSKLVEKTPGDADRDALEKYVVAASAAEIAAFFSQTLSAAGWQKDGPSTDTAMFFRKGKVKLGVLGNDKGGTFTLVGSS